MVRLTMHLSGVKPILVTNRKKNEETGKYDYFKKKKTFNTVAFEGRDEQECMAYMAQFLEEEKNKNVRVEKHYFTNVY